ncbi:hypothetical protein D9M69_456580 [compost metagenome]
MLMPSMGFCGTPLSVLGASMPAASRMVGTMSVTEWNWLRRPPLSLILAGQEMTSGLRVPPKCEATCLVHWNGVFMAWAQPAGKWLKCFGPPSSSITLRLLCQVSITPLKIENSLVRPSIPPSAEAPLSPTT